jgi:ribosomal protein L16 Arg81 hydroxylase
VQGGALEAGPDTARPGAGGPAAALGFCELIAPVEPARFFAEYYGKKSLHIPAGALDKAARTVAWQQINELLAMTSVWSDTSLELALEGRSLPPRSYCYDGLDREGRRTLRPDLNRVQELIARGATLVLNYIDALLPEIRGTAAAVASATGAPVSVSLFASWQKVQGYDVHFDTQNVFALQVVGRKTWRIYANREENPARIPGFDSPSVSAEEGHKRKGPLLMEVTLEPNDLLYVPPGFYHQALAETDASVHVGYGACHFVVQDFFNLLARDLPTLSAFRAPLAHFDEPETLARQLAEAADLLRDLVRQPQQAKTMRQYLRSKAFEQFAVYDLPNRRPNQRFRLRRQALTAAPSTSGDGLAAQLGAWARQVELFALSDLQRAFPVSPTADLEAALRALVGDGTLEAL